MASTASTLSTLSEQRWANCLRWEEDVLRDIKESERRCTSLVFVVDVGIQSILRVRVYRLHVLRWMVKLILEWSGGRQNIPYFHKKSCLRSIYRIKRSDVWNLSLEGTMQETTRKLRDSLTDNRAQSNHPGLSTAQKDNQKKWTNLKNLFRSKINWNGNFGFR